VDKPQDVNAYQFTNISVQFAPEYTRDPVQGTTRSLLTGLDFKPVSSITGARAFGDDDGSDNSGGGGSGGTNPDDEFIDPTA